MTQPFFTDEEWEAADERDRKRQELLVEAEKAQVRNIADVRAREQAPQRAEVLGIEKRTNVPFDTVERNLDEMRARDAWQQLGPQSVEYSPAWRKLLNSKIAPLVMQNPASTRAISDAIDFRTVGSPQQGALGAGIDQGNWMTEVAKLGWRVKFGLGSDADNVNFNQMRLNPPEVPDAPGYLDDVGVMVASQVPVQASILAYGTTAAAGGAALGGMSGGLPGAGAGGASMFVVGTAFASYHLEGGLAYADMRGEAERVLSESGEVIPHGAIVGASELVGVLNGALEFLSFGVMTRNPFVAGLKRKLSAKAGLDIIKSKTLRPYLIAFGKRMAVSAGTEASTEFAQEQVLMAVNQALIASTTSLSAQVPEDWSERSLKSFLSGFIVGPAMTTAVAPYHAAVMRVGMNKQTLAHAKRLDAITAARLKDGGLADADPQAVREWIQGQIEEGGGDPNLYLPADNIAELFQEDETLAESLPEVAEQLAEAQVAGTDVVIPISDYATYLAAYHEKLKGVVRHGLGERNTSEAESNSAEDEANLRTELEALAGTEEGAVEPTPGERVEQSMVEKLIRTASASPETAARLADLLRQHAERRASDPAVGERAFEEADIGIEGPLGAQAGPGVAAELGQPVNLDSMLNELRGTAPEAAAEGAVEGRLAGTKVVDESGNPETVYHGTSSARDALELEDRRGIGGIFFTRNRAEAQRRAEFVANRDGGEPRVLEAKVGIKNPSPPGSGLRKERVGQEGETLESYDGYISDSEIAVFDRSQIFEVDPAPTPPAAATPESAELAAMLEQLGFDLEQMTNEEVIEALGDRFADAGTTLFQPVELDNERPLAGAFHSALGRVLRESPQRKMTVPQLRKMLQKKTVKKDEVVWSGVEEYLAALDPEAKVDLDEMMEVIKLIKVEEVVLGERGDNTNELRELWIEEEVQGHSAIITEDGSFEVRDSDGFVEAANFATEDEALESARENVEAAAQEMDAQDFTSALFEMGVDIHSEFMSDGATQHETYVLDGGTEYRETLITMPADWRQAGGPPESVLLRQEINALEKRLTDTTTELTFLPSDTLSVVNPERARMQKELQTIAVEYNELNAQLDAIPREQKLAEREQWNRETETFTGGHYGSTAPNVLVHVRHNDRIGPNGEKVLFIEEIQDDWAKAGRKEGYGGLSTAESEELASLQQQYQAVPSPDRHTRVDYIPIVERIKELQAKGGGVPNRPFKSTGHELALKRMIALAINEGYDSVAWTPGHVQVERYETELRQTVDSIRWEVLPSDGEQTAAVVEDVDAWIVSDPNGERVLSTSNEDRATALADNIGGTVVREQETVTPAQAPGEIAVSTYKDGNVAVGMQVDPQSGLVKGSTAGDGIPVDTPLEDVVGKDIAKQILEGGPSGTVEGDNLTIGGKGFTDIYDTKLVKAANKLGKKYGAKVEMGEVESDALIGQARRAQRFNRGEELEVTQVDEGEWTILNLGVPTATYPDRMTAEAQRQRLIDEVQVIDASTVSVHTLNLTPEMKSAVQEEGLPLFQPAFHGTPHRFDKFTLDHIGEGEGAQAFGWGLYFASRRGVAEYYKESLTKNARTYAVDGVELDDPTRPGGGMVESLDRAAESPESLETRIDFLKRRLALISRNDSRSRLIGREQRVLAFAESLRGKTVTITSESGQLFEADIPESGELLDYDLPLSEQPEGVRLKLEPIMRERFGDAWEDHMQRTGQNFYYNVALPVAWNKFAPSTQDDMSETSDRDAAKMASQLLLEAGIPGLQYTEGQLSGGGGTAKNFVIWDEEAINVLNTFFQPADKGIRGSLSYNNELTNVIMRFTKSKNLSTGLHESAHLFFAMMLKDAQTEGIAPQLQTDMQTALDFLGMDSVESLLQDSQGNLSDEARAAHEKWARAFEMYLREGKAPSAALRESFSRFKSWLLHLYKTLRGLDVELNPEMRQVFDRLLASDEQIAQAKQQDRMLPAFESAEAGEMTPAQFAAYQQSYERMDVKAQEELGKKVMREFDRELTAEWKENWEKMQAEVEAEINADPIVQLRHWLQMKTLLNEETPEEMEHIRLDLDTIKEKYGGKSTVKALGGTGSYSMVQKDGMDPELLAPQLGFESGQEVVDALVATTNRKLSIKIETDKRMKETYGDILNDGTMSELAIDALESDAKGDFLIRQQRILGHRAGIANNLPQAIARDVAREVVQGKQIRSLRPDLYRNAEARAVAELLGAVESGDWQAAHEAGRKQLLNHFLAVAAVKAKEQTTKWHGYTKTFDKKAKRERLARAGEDYLDQVDSLLERFDLRQMSNKKADLALADWVNARLDAAKERNDELGGVLIAEPAFVINEQMLDRDFRQHWRTMTVSEMGGLVDAVKNIEHLAMTELKLLLERDKLDFETRVEQSLETINANQRTDRPISIETGNQLKEQLRLSVGAYFASHRKLASLLSEMDGGYGGVLFDMIIRPMDEAGNRENSMRIEAGQRLGEIFAPYMGDLTQKFKRTAETATFGLVDAVTPDITKQEKVPGTGSNVMPMSKIARLMAVLNMGNAGNLQRLTDGYGWSQSDALAILDTLTKEDMDFVQGVWDYIEEYWGDVSDLQRRIAGVAPKKIKRQAIETRHGTYAGGYFPVKYDSSQTPQAWQDSVADAAHNMMSTVRGKAKTQDSFTKQRVRKVVDRQIQLDFGVIFGHVGDVVHRLAWQEWLMDTGRLLADKRVAGAIMQGYGVPVYRTMIKAHEDIASGDVPAEMGWEQAVNWMRKGSSIAGMGLSITTALYQPFGLTQSMRRIGPKWVGRGIAKWWRGPEEMNNTVEWIYSLSSMMKNRGTVATSDMNREIREVQSDLTEGGVLTPAAKSYFYLVVKSQILADVPTWLGAYEKEMEIGSGDESRAVAMADRAVIDAQGGGQIQDQAAIQRGGPLMKAWTNFYSFFNTTWNNTAESYRRTDFRKPDEFGKFLVDMLLLYTLPAVLSDLMKDAIMGTGDEDEGFLEYALRSQAGYMLSTLVGVREFGGIATGYMDWSGPAGVRGFEAANALGKQIGQGDADAALFKSAVHAAGIFLHLPSVAIMRAVEGGEALIEGETSNPAALLLGAPKE